MKQILLLFAIATVFAGCDSTPEPPIEDICGCPNQNAVNYNVDANCNDNSCVYLEDKQRQMALLFTSTGCDACGIWGIDCYDSYLENLGDDVVPVISHFKYNDPLINEMSQAWREQFSPAFSPFFITGTTATIDLENGCEGSEKNAITEVDALVNGTRYFNLGIKSMITDSTVRCIAAFEKLAHNAEVESYRIATFLLENGFVYDQRRGWKKYIEDMIHNHSIRAGFTTLEGELIEIEVGQKDFIDLELPLNEKWKAENLYAVAIIWSQNADGDLEVENIISSEKQ